MSSSEPNPHYPEDTFKQRADSVCYLLDLLLKLGIKSAHDEVMCDTVPRHPEGYVESYVERL